MNFCNKNLNSIIIFVGANSVSTKEDFSDQVFININAKYKYFIDIDTQIVLKRRFKRHIEFMNANIERYFKKALEKGKIVIDFDLWKEKIESNKNSDYYKKNNYKFLENSRIFKDVDKKLKSNPITS